MQDHPGNKQNLLRQIPKVDTLLAWPENVALLLNFPRPEVLTAVRTVLTTLREKIASGQTTTIPSQNNIINLVTTELGKRTRPSLRPVVNGTGVVIHTNLGRSPLPDEAVEAIRNASSGYSNLEFDLDTGERGTRYSHVEGLICELTGAESALVVNNNAAAVLLALSSLAQGREVIVSRGELVEIGGSFRIPDVMKQSGAILVEVGTTNRTHLHDYQSALTESTALFLKVHTSNYSIVGFTAEASVSELSALGKEKSIPVMLDAGSGCLIDLAPHGIRGEPTIRNYLEAGAAVVTFSGDKLLGGPQAGIIAGNRDVIAPMKNHPLLRALRIDKLSLAALEATLRLYRDEKKALTSIPVLRMLTTPPAALAQRANRLVRRLRRLFPDKVKLTRHQGESCVGGGSFPLLQLPSTQIELSIEGISAQRIDAALRSTAVPVLGRIHRDRFLLDIRTINDHDITALTDSILEAVQVLTPIK
jgi:L-seryl-tRNA(Ser) seleniumtransferase